MYEPDSHREQQNILHLRTEDSAQPDVVGAVPAHSRGWTRCSLNIPSNPEHPAVRHSIRTQRLGCGAGSWSPWPFAVPVPGLSRPPQCPRPSCRHTGDNCCSSCDKQPAPGDSRSTCHAKQKRWVWHVLKQMNNQHGCYLYLLGLIQLDARLSWVNRKLKIAAPAIRIVH